MRYGAINRNKPGNRVSGDAYLFHENGNHTLVALIDGLGAGEAAHEAAQKTAREGVLASEVDRAASDVLRENWEGEWWGIGHGVGLEVHEWPFVGYHRITDDRAYARARARGYEAEGKHGDLHRAINIPSKNR